MFAVSGAELIGAASLLQEAHSDIRSKPKWALLTAPHTTTAE
jgi:hypothetical protein